MDFNRSLKVICEQMHLNHNNAFFFLGLSSGDETKVFLIQPALMKTFSDTLQKEITKFEQTNGPIDTSGTGTAIQSPFLKN
jgi:hypothetical protein